MENFEATTTAPDVEPTAMGVRSQGSGCACTEYLRTSDVRAAPFQAIPLTGTSRASHQRGSVVTGFTLPGGFVTSPPREV